MQVGHGKEFALWNDDYNWLSMAGTISVKSLWQLCGLGIVINLIIMGKETAWIYKDRKGWNSWFKLKSALSESPK